jgi:hypothetical protein
VYKENCNKGHVRYNVENEKKKYSIRGDKKLVLVTFLLRYRLKSSIDLFKFFNKRIGWAWAGLGFIIIKNEDAKAPLKC